MSEEIKVSKKRGRPKKVAEADAILIVDDSIDTDRAPLPTKSRKTSVKKTTTKSLEPDALPKKRIIRRSLIKSDLVGDATDPQLPTHRTKKDAKSQILENLNPAVQLTASPTSNILDQATAFDDHRELESPADGLEVARRHTTAIAAQTETTELHPLPSNDQQKTAELVIKFRDLSRTSRQLSANYIDLSLLQSSNYVQSSEEFINTLKLRLSDRVNTALRVETLRSQTTSFSEKVQNLSSTVRELIQDRREHQVSVLSKQLKNLAASIQETEAATNHLKAERLERQDRRRHQTSILDKELSDLEAEITQTRLTTQQIQARIAEAHRHQQLQDLSSNISSFDKDLRTSELMLKYSKSFSLTTQQYLAMRSLKTQTPTSPSSPSSATQRSASSSTPPSSRPQQQPRHQPQSTPQVPPRATPRALPSGVPPPKPSTVPPTQQPYDQLVKSRAFKQQSRKWTSYIVGIPVLIMSSYVLFNTYQDTLRKRDFERMKTQTGGAGRGIGVDSSSNVGVNGGV